MVVSVSVQHDLRIRYAFQILRLIPSLVSLGTIRLDLAEADVELSFYSCQCRLRHAWSLAKSASAIMLRGRTDLVFDRSDPEVTITKREAVTTIPLSDGR